MLGQKMQDAMNEQIKNELYSAYLYLSMAAYFETENLTGFAHWMREQAEEEQEHALKFFDFINERGGRVTLHAIDQPPADFGSPLNVFEETLSHEQKVTSLIHDLYALALEENDYASQVFLQWYVAEQVEEEANVTEILERLKMLGDRGQGLLMLDRALGERGS
ncbi:MAG: ferritin [Anaerolineae bacterium]